MHKNVYHFHLLSFISPFNISNFNSSLKGFASSKKRNTRKIHVGITSNGSIASIIEPMKEILSPFDSENNFSSSEDSGQNSLENSIRSPQEDQFSAREWRRKNSDASTKNDYSLYHKDIVSNSIPLFVQK
jgi:hypothetical protein